MESYIIEKRWILLAPVRQCLKHDSTSASRFARDGHLARVSAKASDVGLNPSQSEALIQKTSVYLAILLNVFR